MSAGADLALRHSHRGYWRGSRSSLTPVSSESGPEGSPPPVAVSAVPSESELQAELLSDAELDAIEDDLARAERTLGLLADDDIDPAGSVAWLAES